MSFEDFRHEVEIPTKDSQWIATCHMSLLSFPRLLSVRFSLLGVGDDTGHVDQFQVGHVPHGMVQFYVNAWG